VEQHPLRAVLSGAFLLASLALAQEPPAAEPLREGIERFVKGEYGEALPLFARARMLDPADWRGPAWQAFTLLEMARLEPDADRRKGLVDEVEAMAVVLVKNAGLGFRDPLRLYLLGAVHGLRADLGAACTELRKADAAGQAELARYAEIDLERNVRQAYALASKEMGRRLALVGRFEDAERHLREARRILDAAGVADPELRRAQAAVEENLGRFGPAIAHLRACADLLPDGAAKQECLADVARVLLREGKKSEGRGVLDAIGTASRHPAVLAVRCRLAFEDAPLDEAIDLHRTTLDALPPGDDAYPVLEDYGALVLRKAAADAAAARPLLEDLLRRAKDEIGRRPECASLHHLAAEAAGLLGDADEAALHRKLHDEKKAASEGKARFDARGRPGCRSE
jgi:tetratricopeptide (TPR) repeat protein